jgi:hypothetical protein
MHTKILPNCARRAGKNLRVRQSGADFRKLLWSKATVVNVAERGERKQTADDHRCNVSPGLA